MAAAGNKLQTLIQHADRLWKAEENNAARLAARSNLVLSAITAVIGLKLYVVGKEIDTVLACDVGWCTVLFWQASALSALFLVVSLWLVLSVRFRVFNTEPASGKMYLPDRLVDDESRAEWLDSEVSEYVFYATYDAASVLRARNAKRQAAVGVAQILFLCGALLLFLSIGLYAAMRRETLPVVAKENAGDTAGRTIGH